MQVARKVLSAIVSVQRPAGVDGIFFFSEIENSLLFRVQFVTAGPHESDGGGMEIRCSVVVVVFVVVIVVVVVFVVVVVVFANFFVVVVISGWVVR